MIQGQPLEHPSKGVPTSTHHHWLTVPGLKTPQPACLTMNDVITDRGCSILQPAQRYWNVCRETKRFYKPTGILKTTAKVDVV